MKLVVRTKRFNKDYDLAVKRGLNIELLDDVIRMLAKDEKLPEKYRDHELSGIWSGFRECHIQSDWLLIYMVGSDKLVLTLSRTGTHSDLF